MADSKLNYFVASGTNAERVAFTPSPPTPAAGPDPGYFFYETDTGNAYTWDGAAWDGPIGGGLTAASTTEVLTGTNTTKGGTPDSIAALWEQGSDVASAGTVSLGEGGYFNITGTTTITDIDFDTDKAGRKAWVKFAGALTLTHNATTLILPTGANITTAAGDTACFISEGSDNVRCVAYNRASGEALVGSGGATWELAGTGQTATGVWDQAVDGTKTTVDFSGLSSYKELLIIFRAVSATTSRARCVRVSVASTFYSSSGDYVQLTAAGVESNDTLMGAHSTASTAARSMFCRISPSGVSGGPKLGISTDGTQRLFVAATGAIDAVRCMNNIDGDLNGGKIYCYGLR